mmetsp:Transcript_111280/g.227846  ORF Transcript_111280/g.227846 Transcript_111280/m.227846 type:complete len:165 (-) Transcript_111280:105-599(-)
MPVLSIPEDKPKILFYAAMMFIQNFGFGRMYWDMYGEIPGGNNCSDMKMWIGLFALDCFVESFVCIWMAMGGYTDDKILFPVMWILHLLVALPYCLCSVTIPMSVFSDEGKLCRSAGGSRLDPLVPLLITHEVLFLVYVWMMLSITYFSFLKPTFITKQTQVSP